MTICGFAAGLVGELGGKRFSRITGVIWLFFGVNIIGYACEQILPLDESFRWGDIRYTPWFNKLSVLNHMPFVLGMFLALVYVLLRREPRDLGLGRAAVAGLLAVGIGMVYPIYLPVVCALIGGFLFAVIADAKLRATTPPDTEHRHANLPYAPLLALAAATLIAATVTWMFTNAITADRVSATFDLLPSKRETLRKALEALIVTSPLVAGAVVALGKTWRPYRVQVMTLLLGAAASLGSYVVLRIPNYSNEYKFLFTAAICLFPFTALALEPLFHRLGRAPAIMGRWPAMAIVIVLIALPAKDGMFRGRPWMPDPLPKLDVSGFDLRLDPGEPFARLCDAIRRETPTDSILVVATDKLHLPTLTRRRLYAPPRTTKVHPGVDLTSDFILTRARGYGEDLVRSRQALVTTLVSESEAASGGASRSAALAQIQALGRPLVFVVEQQAHGDFLAWLERRRKGRLLVEDTGLVAWLAQYYYDHSNIVPDAQRKPKPAQRRAIRQQSAADRHTHTVPKGPMEGPRGVRAARVMRHLACAILCVTTAVAVTAPKDHIHSRDAFRRLSREARHRPVVLRPVVRRHPLHARALSASFPTRL